MDEVGNVLSTIRKELKSEKDRLDLIRLSIERCERDNFTHLPLYPMYKRPTYAPTDC